MKARILVVDDEETFRNMLVPWLRDDGHEVYTAVDGEQAIQVLQSKSFDLVLLDLRMPGIDGIGVLNHVKERYPETEVVMLTAYGDIKSAVQSMKLGASDFLTKPVDADSLTARVRSILRAHFAEQQREKVRQELEQAKADFTAMLVHDLRDPLGGVKITLECIIGRGPGQVLDEVHLELLEAAVKGTEKVQQIIDELLDLSKLEAGKIRLSKSSVDFPSIVNVVCKTLRIPIQEKKFQLEQHFTRNLPRVYVDPDKIGQVVTNFVSNSIKFTPEGGRIRISADVQDVLDELVGKTKKQLVVSVEDNGPGIAKEQLPLLFQKYEQTETGKTSKRKGTGLGLAINRRIIEAHDGKVWVESEVDKGTTFYFTLPVPSSGSNTGSSFR